MLLWQELGAEAAANLSYHVASKYKPHPSEIDAYDVKASPDS